MSQPENLTIENLNQYSDSMLVLLSLGDGNPGAYTVVSKLFEIIELDETKNDLVMNFICILLKNNIIGPRLWYIYKNEAKFDINNLVNLNVSKFTNDYFYEKFEKYTTNI